MSNLLLTVCALPRVDNFCCAASTWSFCSMSYSGYIVCNVFCAKPFHLPTSERSISRKYFWSNPPSAKIFPWRANSLSNCADIKSLSNSNSPCLILWRLISAVVKTLPPYKSDPIVWVSWSKEAFLDSNVALSARNILTSPRPPSNPGMWTVTKNGWSNGSGLGNQICPLVVFKVCCPRKLLIGRAAKLTLWLASARAFKCAQASLDLSSKTPLLPVIFVISASRAAKVLALGPLAFAFCFSTRTINSSSAEALLAGTIKFFPPTSTKDKSPCANRWE